MSGGWPGLPPIDLGGWSSFQRTRLQQYGKERIDSLGAVASDWGSEAQRRIDEITGRVGEAAAGIQAALPGGSAWEADLERIRQEAQASEAQFPAPEPTGPAGFTLPTTGTPEGEAITSALAETATRETPGGAFVTNVARNVTGNLGPMTAETPVENVAGMAGLALQNVGAPLPGRWAGRAFNPGVVQEAGARAVAEAIPGGQTSVLEGAEIPPYVPFLGGQTLTKDTPVLGGLTTPDELLPLAAGAFDPEDIVGLGNQALRAADGAATPTGVTGDSTAWARKALDDLAARYGTPPQEALGYRVGGPPTGPSAPGAGMTPEQMAQRVREADDAIHIWQGGETAEVDYVARLLRAGQEGEVLPQGATDWQGLIGSGRVDPDALNRALIGYREEGLSEGDALARAIGTPEERATNLEIGARGVRDPSGLTTGLLKNAIADLAEGGRPFATKGERGAANVGRNVAPNPAGKKNAWEYVDKNGNSQWLSTPYEVLFAKQLDANPDVAYWTQSSSEAVMETTVRHGGTPKVFTPDFIIVGTDGRIQVVEIKNIGAYRQPNWRVPEKLREAEEFFNSKGVGFSIFVEDQLGRGAAKGATPEDFLPDANGRSGVVNGFFVGNEEGSKVGRFDPVAARAELAKRLREAGGAWELEELGYLSGRHPATQEQYDELVASTHWPAWTGRRERGSDPNRGPARITPVQRAQIIKAGPGGVDPAEGGYGTAYTQAYPVRPEQGGYDPRWTPHRAYAEFNQRQRAKGAPAIAVDAVEAYPQMLRQVEPIRGEWAKQVADGQHGLTVDPLSGQVGVPGRYAVSIAPGAGLELKGKPEDIHPDRLAMWMAELEPVLRRIPNARVGFWYDSKNDTTYVDLSIGLNNRKQAEALGMKMSQYAIFDSVTKKDIDLVYPGYAPGTVPPPPPKQEQRNALASFGRQRGRSQPGRAGAPGAGAGAVPGGADGVPGSVGGRGARGLGRGGPGATAPGPAGPAGPSGEGLGGLEQGGVGEEPFGTYPLPVPYEPATDTGGRAAPREAGPAGEASGLAAGRAGASGDWRSALDSALASVQPYGAAATQGQRAFDVAGGTLGGATAAATAEEDATPQERAGRFLAGATAGSLAGPTARGALGRVAGRSVSGDGVLGITSRAAADRLNKAIEAGEPADVVARLATEARDARVAEQAARAAGNPTPSGGVGGALSRLPELMSAIPLAAPTSLAANLTGGAARSFERVMGVLFEGRPIDALVDLGGMARALPGAVRGAGRAFREGPTAANPGMTGAVTPDDLLASTNRAAQVATSGVRANAATDQFWRGLNEAGARAQAGRRGLGAEETEEYATRAGDFATFTGSNSRVAKLLTDLKGAVRDPEAPFFDRGVAAAVTSMAPYVMMPERLLRATVGSLVPVEAGVGYIKALRRGDKAAAREFRGRALAGLAATTALTYHYFNGGITGDRPEDANEARRREARGEQWNTIETPAGRVPTRYLGSLGMQASAVATTLDQARRAKEKGGDFGAVIENGFNGASRWALDTSYLADLAEFGADVQGPEGAAGALRNVAAGVPSRITGPVTGMIGAADEYEREAEGFPEQVAMRTGLRAALPARIDPATGEAQRRRGNVWDRYWGTRGSAQSPEGQELARLKVQPRVIGRTEEYLGAVRSREDRRKVQQVLGSEANRVVRRTMSAAYYEKAKDIDKQKYLQDALREAAKAAEARLWKMGIRPAKPTRAEEEAEFAAEMGGGS